MRDDSGNKLILGDVDYEEWERRLRNCVAVRIDMLEGYGSPLFAAIDITDNEQFILCGTFSFHDTMTFVQNNNLKVALMEEVSIDSHGNVHSHFTHIGRDNALRRHTLH